LGRKLAQRCRVIAPDAAVALDSMRANLECLCSLIHSQRVLLALTQAGMSRNAYRAVQRVPVFDVKSRFRDLLVVDKQVMRYVSPERLDAEFDDTYHTKHLDTIFRSVFD
jgi:adenylosuccinate lyase